MSQFGGYNNFNSNFDFFKQQQALQQQQLAQSRAQQEAMLAQQQQEQQQQQQQINKDMIDRFTNQGQASAASAPTGTGGGNFGGSAGGSPASLAELSEFSGQGLTNPSVTSGMGASGSGGTGLAEVSQFSSQGLTSPVVGSAGGGTGATGVAGAGGGGGAAGGGMAAMAVPAAIIAAAVGQMEHTRKTSDIDVDDQLRNTSRAHQANLDEMQFGRRAKQAFGGEIGGSLNEGLKGMLDFGSLDFSNGFKSLRKADPVLKLLESIF